MMPNFNPANYSVRATKSVGNIVINSNTSNQVLIAAANNLYTDLYGLFITNNSGTNTMVWISDGTQAYPFYASATQTSGFSFPAQASIPATNANTAWTCNTSTSVANVYITALFVKNNI